MKENIVLDVVEKLMNLSINCHSDFIEERDCFLFFFFCRLVDLSSDKTKFNLNDFSAEKSVDDFVEHLVEIASKESPNSATRQAINNFLETSFRLSKKALPSEAFHALGKSEKNAFNKGLEFRLSLLKDPVKTLLISKVLPDIKYALAVDNNLIIKIIYSIDSLNSVEPLSTLEAALIYSRVLIRLQETGHPLQTHAKFNYQEIPSDFIDVIMEIGAFDDVNSVYSPYEVTVEQSLYLALDFPDKEYRVESVKESNRHIYRKFGLAQAQSLICTQSNCLSYDSIINEKYFDTSICLLQPKVKKDERTGKSKEEGHSIKVVYKEHLYIKRMLESLNEQGKGYVITGRGPLFRKRDMEYRKSLIESNLVDAVITLPAGILTFCAIPMIMTVLNKAKTTDDVLFINATEFQSEYGHRVVMDDIERLAEEYKVRPENSSFSFTVPNEKIINNNYSLNSLNYMKQELVQQLSLDTLNAVRSSLLNNLESKEKSIIRLLDQ